MSKPDDLFALMHDTMSPVNTIKGAVTLLKQGNLSPEETTRMLDAIETRANRLNEILDNYFKSERAKHE